MQNQSQPPLLNFKLSSKQSPSNPNELEEMKFVSYASLVGSLMYEMVSNIPDLAHAMSVVSRYMSNPRKPHWEATKWIVRYLKETTKKGLVYTKSYSNIEAIVGFVNPYYAADLDMRRSLIGYVFTLSGNVIN